MAKAKTFADKMKKDQIDFTKHCPKCGESITMIQLVSSELSEKTGAYRFKQSFVGVCKCNQNNVMEPVDRSQIRKTKPTESVKAEAAVEDQPEEVKATDSTKKEPVAQDQSKETKASESGEKESDTKDTADETKTPESGDAKSG